MLQVSNPSSDSIRDPADRTITNAVETVFPLCTEYCVMCWHNVAFVLSYKYDLPYILPDILDLLDNLLREEVGEWECTFPSDSFCVEWHVLWEAGQLTIDGSWHSVAGGVESLLKNTSSVAMPVDTFTYEWKYLLKRVIDALYKAGYSADNVDGLRRMEDIESRITRYGMLYERFND